MVLLITAALVPAVLTPKDMRDFAAQLLGAITFTSNVVLWTQTGYFAAPAVTKPLLHMWSLSLEEQYYLLVPIAMVLLPRKWWKSTVWTVFAISLALCLAFSASKPGATFFLLPTRAWELLLGCLAALGALPSSMPAFARRATWPAVAVIVLLPVFPCGLPHPGVDALAVCMATLVVLCAAHPHLGVNPISRALARLGDMSYSLYLVHWPLGALAASVWLTGQPQEARWALLAATFPASWLLYRYVEMPARKAPASRRILLLLAAGTAVLVVVALALYQAGSRDAKLDEAGGGNLGLADTCEYADAFSNRRECRTSESPRMMLWGDSQAMHLADGLAGFEGGVVQATKTTCGPLLGLSALREQARYDQTWARGCVSFNDSVLDHLKTASHIEVVVLSSWFSQYLEGGALIRDGAGLVDGTTNPGRAFKALQSTAVALRSIGKRVILVGPAPSSGFDVARCLDAARLGKVRLGMDSATCEISEEKFKENFSGVLRLLDRIERENVVPVIRLDRSLCSAGKCVVQEGQTPLYVDGGHFSHAGSRIVGTKLQLATRAFAQAR
ncbi:MAG: acyltransferase [Ramlibacter sp.]|nr:acyltransferase [Ramlibacter sp.]